MSSLACFLAAAASFRRRSSGLRGCARLLAADMLHAIRATTGRGDLERTALVGWDTELDLLRAAIAELTPCG